MMDMSMFLDVGLMDDKDSVPPADLNPDALDASACISNSPLLE